MEDESAEFQLQIGVAKNQIEMRDRSMDLREQQTFQNNSDVTKINESNVLVGTIKQEGGLFSQSSKQNI